jgi:TPR repeat protein
MNNPATFFALLLAVALTGCSSLGGMVGLGEKKEAKAAVIPSNRFNETLGEAVEGDDIAQFQLGEWYRNGKQVNQDFAQAYAWFIISAANGHLGADARIRAGWRAEIIARGKELAEIYKEKYPNALRPLASP